MPELAGWRRERMPHLTTDYASAGVSFVWLVDPLALRLDGQKYVIEGGYADDAKVRAVPFDAIELDLSIGWADVVLSPEG